MQLMDRGEFTEHSKKELKDLLLHYASRHGEKLFSTKGFNTTVTSRIGKKRLNLINIILEGFQYKF